MYRCVYTIEYYYIIIIMAMNSKVKCVYTAVHSAALSGNGVGWHTPTGRGLLGCRGNAPAEGARYPQILPFPKMFPEKTLRSWNGAA
jgi:hypothetical protein